MFNLLEKERGKQKNEKGRTKHGLLLIDNKLFLLINKRWAQKKKTKYKSRTQNVTNDDEIVIFRVV